jgi:uncharacterized delta-60 repeat protein
MRVSISLRRGLLVLLLSVAFPGAAFPAAGDLDPTFGGDGTVTTRFPGARNVVGGMIIQPNGKIIVVGTVDGQFALARYRTDGGLDASFGRNGKVRTDLTASGDGASAVALQPDGKIVTVGVAAGGFDTDARFAVVRYLASGRLDTAFGFGDGRVQTNFTPGVDAAYAVDLQADGKIVVAGHAGGSFAFARYRTNGRLDPSFSGDGKRTSNITSHVDVAHGVAVQADGKIVAAGGDAAFALIRYKADGTLDTSFGTNGRVIGPDGAANAIALQADGKIANAVGGPWALARYNADGTLDAGFDGDGLVTTAFRAPGTAFALAIQSDGKIVAAGQSNIWFTLTRYRSDGALDPSFSGDGKVLTLIDCCEKRGHSGARGVGIQADGKIVAAGIERRHRFAVARFIGG